jgi:hypothetical protein
VDEPVSLPAFRRRRLGESVTIVVERLRAGASIGALSVEYGVSQEAVRRAVARAGITTAIARVTETGMAPPRTQVHRLPGRSRSRVFEPVKVRATLTRYVGGECLRSLVRATGVSRETIRRGLGEGI